MTAPMAPAEMARVALEDCPIGLFMSADGELCLKTEYGNNEGRVDAFIVSSGEFFWGAAPQTIASQRKQMVAPFDIGAALRTSYGLGLAVAATLVKRSPSWGSEGRLRENTEKSIRAQMPGEP